MPTARTEHHQHVRFHFISPTFNSAATLDEMLRSVYRQNAAMNGELVSINLIDGGSTDGTPEIAQSWQRRFEERSHALDTTLDFSFRSEPDEGLYDAMNKGVRAVLETADAQDLIAILGSDDWYSDDALQLVATVAAEHPDVSLFYGAAEFATPAAEPTGRYYPVQTDLCPRSFAGDMPLSHPATFIRAGVYRAYGLYDTRYRIAADYDLLYRFIRAGVSSHSIPEVLVFMREGGVSTDPAFEIMSYKECIAVRIAAGARPFSEWLRYYRKRLNGRLYRGASHLPGVKAAYERYREHR
ncbi:MAG: glycosyltransferase [Actinomycetia bacterium]|nr:glycosyltransferase [Actinomycetes bacterium]